MRLSIGRSVLLVCALLASGAAAPAARGDALSGTLEFQFSDDDQIWDFGSFEDCDTVSDPASGLVATLCLELDLEPNAKGEYEGDAELTFTDDIQGTLNGPASGKLRGKDASGGGSDPADKASFKLKAEGPLTFDAPFDIEAQTTVALSCKGEIVAGIYETLCDVKVKLEGFGSASEKNVPFASHADGGDWDVTINLDLDDSNHYSGVANDSVGPYFYEVSGTYNEKQDESKLTLKGMSGGDSAGAKISLKNVVSDGPSTGAGSAKYKVQGYSGKAEVATD